MNRSSKFLLISSYFNTIAFGILSPLYALFVVEIGGTGSHASFSWAAYAATAGLLMLVGSRFLNKVPQWWSRIIISGFFILAVASFGYLTIHSILALYLIQFIFALGVSMTMPTMKLMYAKYADRGREAEEWALLDGGNLLILSGAAFLGGWLFDLIGFAAVFILMGSTQVVAAVLAYFSLRKL